MESRWVRFAGGSVFGVDEVVRSRVRESLWNVKEKGGKGGLFFLILVDDQGFLIFISTVRVRHHEVTVPSCHVSDVCSTKKYTNTT